MRRIDRLGLSRARVVSALAAVLLGASCSPGAPAPVAPGLAAPASPRAPDLPDAQAIDDGASIGVAATLEEPFAALPVPGFGDAVVSAPAASNTPKPLLVATHGAGGTPEWYCRFYRETLGERGFVLCPRGKRIAGPTTDAFYYPGHPELEREVSAAMGALIQRYGARVDASRAVYSGFSQGATIGALDLPREPAAFTRAALVEGGFDEWDVRTAERWRRGGAERVLFVCGRERCATSATQSARYLTRAGVETRVVHVAGAGHVEGGKVGEAVGRELAWLLEGDARWGGR